MQFDQLCTVAERHMPSLIPVLERARIFVFPGRAHEILPKQYTQEEVDIMREHFFLPFSTMAVEDTASCTVLWDSEKNQKGIDSERYFIECVVLDTDQAEFDDGALSAEAIQDYNDMCEKWPGACLISVGALKRVVAESGEKVTLYGHVDWSFVASKREIFLKPYHPLMTNDPEKTTQGVLRNVRAAFEEIFFFNNPARFVLETRPAKTRPMKKKKGKARVLRSHNRPVYTLLEPKEIRDKLGIGSNGDDKKKAPHARRRHFRTYPDDIDKWPKVRGKTIVVPAMWVGPDEAERDGKKYKVRLDL